MNGDACQLCGDGNFRRLPYYYLLNGKRIQGVRCAGCGLVTVSPKPTRDDLASLYSGDYFKSDYHCGHRELAYEDEQLTRDQLRVLERFIELRPHGRMLEVGAAGGKFLLKAKERGYEVTGVELSREACDIAGRLGVRHFCGELHEAGFEAGSFDLAYMGDVLEHMPEPYDALVELNRVLAPGGVLGLSCPTNIGLLSSRAGLWVYGLLGREMKAPLPPYHLYEFTPRHIKMLLEKAGFHVLITDVDIIPPWRIKLRGGLVERVMKAALHWPNYIITLVTGMMGDRVTIFARKQ